MKRIEWISGAAGILVLFIAGFGCIFFFASKENSKNITREETFVYQAETDNTSMAHQQAFMPTEKCRPKKKPFT
jgi:flagellar basal body-associated protein FliL